MVFEGLDLNLSLLGYALTLRVRVIPALSGRCHWMPAQKQFIVGSSDT
jgi:hypothetical protein